MTYVHINARERMSIFTLHQWGLSLREIGRRLNRSHTTISREMRRNRRVVGCYCDRAAQHFTEQRKASPRHHRRYQQVPLRDYVVNKLSIGWSPEIICQRLKRDYPLSLRMRCSAEAIYQWVYRDRQQGGSLYTCLVCRHAKRRKQRLYGTLRGLIPHRLDISKRPLIVSRRARFGDWEGDTMVGRHHQGRLVTHVERKSRYLLAATAQDGTAVSFNTASLSLYDTIPSRLCKTLTLDNGSENASFQQLEKQLSCKIYFATPYASWERGTNENTNGLLRRYFPKGTNFLSITKKQLDHVVHLLNHRPRKCLNYRTPFEVFNPITNGALGN